MSSSGPADAASRCAPWPRSTRAARPRLLRRGSTISTRSVQVLEQLLCALGSVELGAQRGYTVAYVA
jgi:hypothetical protein